MQTIANPQIELAFEYVRHTNKHIFLTGKAGTGKTTFLSRVRAEVPKRMAVVAPTGVAAINAGGVTIHSLFQLPFGPLVPGTVRSKMNERRFGKEKIKLLRSLDLLIIDEISMVRGDVLDAIDEVLRRYRSNPHPFGGLQLLMIGDLHQLPPVVKPQEWELLGAHYDTPYFFSSLALKKTDAVTIELKHIYRQADSDFIALLNKVRDNQMDAAVFEQLNSRYLPDQIKDKEDEYITLTSHNAGANSINAQKLGALKGKRHIFPAKIKGDFPAHAYPTEEELEVKEGAQVMFTKNDPDPDKRFFNGKIGRVTKIKKEDIWVKCPDDEDEILVKPLEWKNVKYSLNEDSKEVEENEVGTFTQYPLKLAWAITIHKSQGLTFDKVIIDAQSAFAHGQVYVALSRCRTFEGILLRSPLGQASVRTDVTVQHYTQHSREQAPDEDQLFQAKKDFQQELLIEYFRFDRLKSAFSQFHRLIRENEKKFQGDIHQELQQLLLEAQEKVFAVGEKFLPQIEAYCAQEVLPDENEAFTQRLQKAGDYFFKQLHDELFVQVKALQLLSDNSAILKNAKEKWKNLKLALFVAYKGSAVLKESFNSKKVSQIEANAELDYNQKTEKAPKSEDSPKNIRHPELYHKLTQWRAQLAAQGGFPAYTVMTTKSLLEIVEVLPSDAKSLRRIHGMGKKRVERFGKEILDIVKGFTQKNQLEMDLMRFASKAPPAPKKPKVDSKAVSLGMFVKEGKTVEEIAKERNLVTGTIRGHLAHYVELGELPFQQLISQEKLDDLAAYFGSAKDTGLALAKQHFGEQYDYGELKLGRLYWEQQK